MRAPNERRSERWSHIHVRIDGLTIATFICFSFILYLFIFMRNETIISTMSKKQKKIQKMFENEEDNLTTWSTPKKHKNVLSIKWIFTLIFALSLAIYCRLTIFTVAALRRNYKTECDAMTGGENANRKNI